MATKRFEFQLGDPNPNGMAIYVQVEAPSEDEARDRLAHAVMQLTCGLDITNVIPGIVRGRAIKAVRIACGRLDYGAHAELVDTAD